mgnify:FL=1
MSTQHTSVRYAKDEYNKQIQANAGSTSFDHPNKESSLAKFRKELERTVRGVKTLYRDTKSAWVYMDGDYMTMGWIGYGDFQTSKSGENKYVVYSRTIENLKYCDSKRQHHMRMAKDMGIALKAAKAELCSYSPVEISCALRKKVRTPLLTVRSDAKKKHNNALEKLGLETYGAETKRMQKTLEGLVSAGHVFVDAEINTDVLNMTATSKEYRRLCADTVPMNFVRIYEKFGKQRVDMTRVGDVTSTYDHNNHHVATWDAEDVPEDVQGQVAVMSMCEDEQFVEGVGYKVDATTFYFYVEDVTT